MKTFNRVWIAALVLALWQPALAQDATPPQDRPCLPVPEVPYDKLAFGPGEKLTILGTYKWGVVNTVVGSVAFELQQQAAEPVDQFYASGKIRTTRFFDTFFKVNDHYESCFNVTNLRPTRFMRDIYEGKYHVENHYTFNPDHTIDVRLVRNNGSVFDTLLPGRVCTFDFVTLVYFIRNMDFSNMKKGDISPISFAVDEEIFELYLRYDGIEEKKIPGQGTFRCIRLAAQTVAGVVFDGKEDLLFWMTDDANHLPVYLESPIVIGRVVGYLGSYENLRYPLTSKLD